MSIAKNRTISIYEKQDSLPEYMSIAKSKKDTEKNIFYYKEVKSFVKGLMLKGVKLFVTDLKGVESFVKS